jgi:DNA-binding transcriptional regulator YhcF (GntR family)
MDSIYRIRPQLDIPIYQQLVDSIRSAIKKGSLPFGQKLPTVQDISQKLSIARGTVKRVYDELERDGLIEKSQGRGTFVCHRPASAVSRKEQAMQAIDNLLLQLEDMGFSPMEVNIFLELKMREHAEQDRKVKVAVVECNPESLAQITEHMRNLVHVDLYPYLLDNVEAYPYILSDDIELVVTTAKHADLLESMLPAGSKIIRVALRLRPGCFSDIIRLRKKQSVGILCDSIRFGNLLHTTCQRYTEGLRLADPQTFSAVEDLDTYLADKDALLVPESYEANRSSEVAQTLRAFQKKGTLIPCAYELDEGSFLYLDVKTKRILEEKF